jgi:hypothetical protein
MSVVDLKVVPRETKIKQSVIEVARAILREAEAGELTCVAGVGVLTNGDVVCYSSDTNDFYKLIGACEQLKFGMLRKHEPEAIPDAPESV